MVRIDCISLKFGIIGKAFVKRTHTCFLGTGRESPLLERLCCDCVLRSFLLPLKYIYGGNGHGTFRWHNTLFHTNQNMYYSVLDCLYWWFQFYSLSNNVWRKKNLLMCRSTSLLTFTAYSCPFCRFIHPWTFAYAPCPSTSSVSL